jgi:hypothetical protein
VVLLEPRAQLGARRRARGAPLFSEVLDLVASGDVVLRATGKIVDIRELDLRDFHALRAIATRLGWLFEETVEIACRNCAASIRHAPCAALALGPFIDGELNDPELDRTLDFGAVHPVPAISLDGGRVALEVRLRPLTVAEAAPLHRALRRRRLAVSERVVRAMGVVAVGPERDPTQLAKALARCSEQAWSAIGDLFIEAHYPLRLSSIAVCPACDARNDVDAPYEREFELSGGVPPTNGQLFPDFDTFAARARVVFERQMRTDEKPEIAMIVDDGVPACDDGGEPLLGAYVPPGGDRDAPVSVAEVTVYYRTFRAVWEQEGRYDWEAELDETIEHELEHHAGWLVGHDPMDDDERDEIAAERARVLGHMAVERAGLRALFIDVRRFLAATWPIWLFVIVATVVITVCGHNPN